MSSFVGREEELAQLSLLVPETRLVTITGAPGVGKTRLALEVVAELAVSFGQAPVVVDLADVTEPDHLVATVAGAVDRGVAADVEGLAAHLGDQSRLMVLDTCERLVDACASLVDVLVARCPGLRVLATSREPLRVADEVAWRVPPLSLPEPGDQGLPELFVDSEAVQLFCVRAAAVERGFVPTSEITPVVAEICRRLDGLPLAIELAAARVALLSPTEILGELDDRFGLLVAAGRSGALRHHSLRAAVDWSHDLLSPAEQALFRRLSVFAGGFTLEAVQEVCARGDVGVDQVLDLLDALVAKSLVVASSGGRHARYHLLESLRYYANERLAHAGETAATLSRHARWCVEFLDEVAPDPDEPPGRQWLARLEAEEENVRAGLQWALTEGDARAAFSLFAGQMPLWLARGRYGEARAWIERVVRLAGRSPAPLRIKVLCDAGVLSVMVGEFPTARAHAEEALALAQKWDDTRGRGEALKLLGFVSAFVDDANRGLALVDEAVSWARQAGDDEFLFSCLPVRARIHLFRGDATAARRDFEDALGSARAAGDASAVPTDLVGLGWAKLRLGDAGGAQSDLEEGLALARDLPDINTTALALVWLGELARLRGQYARAVGLFEECAALARAAGTPYALARAQIGLARLCLARGDLEGARTCADEALTLGRDVGVPYLVSPALQVLAEAAWSGGDLDTARRLAEEALGVARRSGDRESEAGALTTLGALARARGDLEHAASLHHEALRLHAEMADRRGIAESLEALGGLAAADDHLASAARLLGSAQALRDAHGLVRPRWSTALYDADVATVREGLGAEELEAAWREGGALSAEEAVAYASRGRGRRRRPSKGWDALTPAERQVADLVAQGLTNAEVAERLIVSPETVKSQLSRAFAKLGVSSRRQLRDAARGSKS